MQSLEIKVRNDKFATKIKEEVHGVQARHFTGTKGTPPEFEMDCVALRVQAEQAVMLSEIAYQLAVMNENNHRVSVDGAVQVVGQQHYPIAVSVQKVGG